MTPLTRIGTLSLLALLFVGCAGTPIRTDPPVDLPEQFSLAGEEALPDRWWEAFEDPSLNLLVDRALADNLTLRAAWARLSQSEAAARGAGAALWPTLNTQAEITRRTDGSGVENRQGTLAASYEVDLWGRLRATSDAAGFEADASAADLRTAAITLSAEVATSWYQLVEQRAQLQLNDEQLDNNRQLLAVVEARFRSGQATASDIHRQRQLLAQTEGERTRIETQLATLTHRMAILLGEAPGGVVLPADAELRAPGPLPATGVPAELVQRRPDLQRALLRLRAADARAAEAVANRFPRLDLSAATATTDGNFGNWLGNLAAQLALPLIDGGRRRAEVDRTRAVVEENLNSYGQSLIEAVREVEDALSREAGQRAFMASLAAQRREVEAVVERERLRYFQGDSSYLSVLDALRSRQQLERQHVTARRELIAERVALVRALAGGWEMNRPSSGAAE